MHIWQTLNLQEFYYNIFTYFAKNTIEGLNLSTRWLKGLISGLWYRLYKSKGMTLSCWCESYRAVPVEIFWAGALSSETERL